MQSTQLNATALTTPTSKGSKGGMVEMESKDEMAEMESKDEMAEMECQDEMAEMECQARPFLGHLSCFSSHLDEPREQGEW